MSGSFACLVFLINLTPFGIKGVPELSIARSFSLGLRGSTDKKLNFNNCSFQMIPTIHIYSYSEDFFFLPSVQFGPCTLYLLEFGGKKITNF